jgi:protease-4
MLARTMQRIRPVSRLGFAAEQVRRGAQAVRSRLPGARPHRVWLELRGSYPLRPERARLWGLPVPLAPAEPTLASVEAAFASLARAESVRSVVLDLSELSVDATTAHALRGLVARLAASGKEVVAWSSELDWVRYLVASAASEVAAPESADVRLVGFGLASAYFGAVLERWGLKLEKIAVGSYKTALDEFVRREMSEAQREQLEALLLSLEASFCQAVATSRGLTESHVRAALHAGVSSARAAKDSALVDRVAYLDELVSGATRYAEVAGELPPPPGPEGGPAVAVLHVDGVIAPGRSRRAPRSASSARVAGAASLAQAARALADDDSVGAVVLAVSSPGGSALASDLLHRELARLDARKPLVAWLGPVAASGGYYVACAARRVVASPVGLTGSIGVFSARLDASRLLEAQGVGVSSVSRGRFALSGSPLRSLGDDERTLFETQAAETYERFLARVASGRKLPRERAHELAQGRVYTGADARDRGLADSLGDLEQAAAEARRLAHLPDRARLVHVDEPSDFAFSRFDDALSLLGSPLGSPLGGTVSALLARGPLLWAPLASPRSSPPSSHVSKAAGELSLLFLLSDLQPSP